MAVVGSEANVTLGADGGQRTLAVKRVRYRDGSVLTFDERKALLLKLNILILHAC